MLSSKSKKGMKGPKGTKKIVRFMKFLGPNQAAVISSFGSYSPRLRRGYVIRWPWQQATIVETAQKSIIVGFYGVAGRFTPVYLSWLLKAFPTREDFELYRDDNTTIFLRETVENALKVIEKICRLRFKEAIEQNVMVFQNIEPHEIQKYEIYEELQKKKIFTDLEGTEYDYETEYVGFFKDVILQYTGIDIANQIPAKVWHRVLSEVQEEIKRWEEDELRALNDRLEEEYHSKVREFEDAEIRDAKLRFDQGHQLERQTELDQLRDELKRRKNIEMDRQKSEKARRKYVLTALKEIETAIVFNKIKFLEAVYENRVLNANIGSQVTYVNQEGTQKLKTMLARKYPIFSRIFGPLFTCEKIQLDMTCSIFFKIKDPFKLVKNVGSEQRATIILVSKLASSLRATISHLTLSEVFEERQKLMEMLLRELDDVAENWGIDIISVAIEEIFLEDPGFQKQLDERREVELHGEKRIEEKKIKANQIIIRGRQQAEKIVMESQAERERELNRVKQEIERARVALETKTIEAETYLKRKEYEAQKIVVETDGEIAELRAMREVLTDNLLKEKLIRELPNIMEKLVGSMQTAIVSPEQFIELVSGTPIIQMIRKFVQMRIIGNGNGDETH